jgi:murein L,D-transpeptidase YcbB/YkuD
MPDMGDYHIWSNIPEFAFRVVRGGSVIHGERIIAGKPDTQTPIFSDEMELVVFQPYWNVPESIKWKELQPQLSRSGGALAKAGLKAQRNGKDVDPDSVEWADADMTQYHIFQPPGPSNALGQVKFLFPNKHDVYMHDTPTKALFNSSTRSFSHGCMRVRDPLKFAELLLSNDKGWDGGKVRQLASSGPENNEVKLSKKIPVHITYFTVMAETDGKLRVYSDIYGHESRINLGIEGKAHLIPQPKEEKVSDWRKEAKERSQRVAVKRQQQEPFNLFKSIFNF